MKERPKKFPSAIRGRQRCGVCVRYIKKIHNVWSEFKDLYDQMRLKDNETKVPNMGFSRKIAVTIQTQKQRLEKRNYYYILHIINKQEILKFTRSGEQTHSIKLVELVCQ